EPSQPEPLYIAWRTAEKGAGLKWWLDSLDTTELAKKLWDTSH
ncbi:hypothetical protein LCGC14_1247330, partial [marine sediment metagenome]